MSIRPGAAQWAGCGTPLGPCLLLAATSVLLFVCSADASWASFPNLGCTMHLFDANGKEVPEIVIPIRAQDTGLPISTLSKLTLTSEVKHADPMINNTLMWAVSGSPSGTSVWPTFWAETVFNSRFPAGAGNCTGFLPYYGKYHYFLDTGNATYIFDFLRSGYTGTFPTDCSISNWVFVGSYTFQGVEFWSAPADGSNWVEANDPTDPVCPNSPHSWGYVKFGLSCCPPSPPPSPPPPLTPSIPRQSPPPPVEPATCSTERQDFVLSRNGVPVNSIPAPIRYQESGQIIENASPMMILANGFNLQVDEGSISPLLTTTYVQWTVPIEAALGLTVLTQSEFTDLTSSAAGCMSPVVQPDIFMYPGSSYGNSINYFVALDEGFRLCEPIPLHLITRFYGMDTPTSFSGEDYMAAEDLVLANDPSNPVCPDSPTTWGYTKFEIMYCPCSPPPSPSPLFSPFPLSPPFSPLSSSPPELVCEKPSWWCGGATRVVRNEDVDGDGILDYTCQDTADGRCWALLSTQSCGIGDDYTGYSPFCPPLPPPPSPPQPLTPATPSQSPPPPPPSLADTFPFSHCTARNVTVSQYRLSAPTGPLNVTSATATYCFHVNGGGIVDTDAGNPCGAMTINKIQFIIDPACVHGGTVKRATVNGVSVPPIGGLKDWNGATYGLLGFSRLSNFFPTFPPAGLTLCMALDIRSSSCGTPEKLCFGGSCTYSLFNADRTCCPASDVPAA